MSSGMQEQTNLNNQDNKQINQNPDDQPVTIEKKDKINYKLTTAVTLSLLVFVLIVVSVKSFSVKDSQDKDTNNIEKLESVKNVEQTKPSKNINKDELESPKAESKLPYQQQTLLNKFNTEILSSNSSIRKELSDKKITKIFNVDSVYIIRTEPIDFVQGPEFIDEGAINIYVVNKDSFATLVKKGHDMTFIAKVYSPKGLENKRIVVQLGGGANVSDLYLLEITSEVKFIKFSDPKDYAKKENDITKLGFIHINEDGSMHAEQFHFKDNELEVFQMDELGNWGVYLSVDLLSGQLAKMRIEKNPVINKR